MPHRPLVPRFRLPFDLPSGSRVLLLGAGGGSDVVCAAPIAVVLREAGCEVWMGNLLSLVRGKDIQGAQQLLPCLYRVEADNREPHGQYCPETFLARWWRAEFGEDRPIWGFRLVGVKPALEAYRLLAQELRLDTLIVLDAGVDGLFLGNEHDLGSPEADAVTLLAAYRMSDCRRIYAFTDFGTEGFEFEVRHADALLRMAELVGKGALLGAAALAPTSRAGEAFRSLCRYIHERIHPIQRSNMVGALLAALEGSFGNTALNPRTETSKKWVSPLTLLYWFFDLVPVAEAKPYLWKVFDSETALEVDDAIFAARAELGVLPRQDIPI